jgi:parallel beta-helix repeat protein
MKLTTIAALMLITAQSFCQTIYYVDKATGIDANNGTSLATAWKTIQKACNSATPNSIVQIKAGTYNENVVVNVSGTLGNPITFKNYQNDVVMIDGTGTVGGTLLTITNKNYLNFQNITIQNKTVNDAQGVLVETSGTSTSTDLSFKNLVIKNIKWTSSAATVPNATKNAQGFIVYGRNGGIKNITIDSCQVFGNILGFSEALALNGNIDGFTVKNCIIHDNTNIGIDIIGHEGTSTNAATDEARNGTVVNNICYKNVSAYATSAGIYIDGSKNVTIEKNSCYENGWGIEVGAELNGTTQNITVKNNLIYNNQEAGMSIGGFDISTTGQVINCTVRNNTFFQNNYANDGVGEFTMTKASNCVFDNNIFYTNSQNIIMNIENISPQTGNKFNYNCWFTPSNDTNSINVAWRGTAYTTFAGYRSATSQDANSVYNNPSITTPVLPAPDLHLLTASACINAGNTATVISSGETDYYNNARIGGGRIDIGANETGTGSGVTAPAAPSALTAVVNSSSQITLNWVDNSTNETGFQVERSLTSGTGFTLISITASNVATFANTGLTNATAYFYRIRSINSAGNSAYTSEVTSTTLQTIPAAPSALAATVNSSSQITLNWADNSTNETGFQIERSLASTSGFVLISTAASNILSFANTGLTASTTYYYRIRSTNTSGSSAYTSVIPATTRSAGGGINITVDGNTGDWTAVSSIATTGTGGMTNLKAYSNATDLYILAQGTTNTNFAIFINTDNNSATGFTAGGLWNPEGNDYMLENGILYKYNGTGTTWSWTTTGVIQTGIVAVKNAAAIEVKIPKANITGLGTVIKIGVDIENTGWSNVGSIPAIGAAEASYVMGAARGVIALTGGLINNKETGVYMYPNPTGESVTVSFYNNAAGSNSQALIYTTDGKRVTALTGSITSGYNKQMLNVSGLADGIYILKFIIDKKQLFSRLLVIKKK